MKLSQRMICLLIAGGMVLSMSSTYKAASFNHVNKVLTVMAGEVLEGSGAPVLTIKLIDSLEAEAIFYLDVTGAKWSEVLFEGIIEGNSAGGSQLEIKRLSQTRLQVKVKGSNLSQGASIKIPMNLEMTGTSAQVSVKGNNTVVSSGTLLVAETASYKGKVSTSEVPVATTGAVMADLIIEESFSRAFAKAVEKEGCQRVITLQLNHNGYAFSLPDSKVSFIGEQGFEGINGEAESIVQIDAQTLEITLPDTSACQYTGSFLLSGIQIKANDKIPMLDKLTVTVKGDLIEETTLEVLEVTDYAITLSAATQTVRAGSDQTIRFSLEEKVEDSLIRNRPTFFYLDEGVYLNTNVEEKVSIVINGQTYLCDALLDSTGKANGFIVNKLMDGISTYDFVVPVTVPLKASGKIHLYVEGRSLVEELQIQVLSIYEPFKLSVTAIDAVVGKKDQQGGEMILSEQAPGTLIQGEKIILSLEQSAIKYGRLPKVEVVAGDLRLGTSVLNGNHIEIPITRRSNVASVIRISDFNITVDQTVPTGGYKLAIWGGALSTLSTEIGKMALWDESFIWVSDKGGNDAYVPVTKPVTVCFTVGRKDYTVGENARTMEAAPYISAGRTMLPIKYVADALGISAGNIVWNNTLKTVTIYTDDIIELKMGSKQMKINGISYTMSAAMEAISGRTFIPVAELSRAMGIETKWNNEKKQVTFETQQA